MRIAVASVRLALAALIAAAVVATFVTTAARTAIVPANFFGYFTIQSNVLAVPVLGASGALLLRRTASPQPVASAADARGSGMSSRLPHGN